MTCFKVSSAAGTATSTAVGGAATGGFMPRSYVYVAFGGPENERFLDLPMPVPAVDEVRVRVNAAAVNPGDWKHRANRRGQRQMTHPEAMGLEVSGVVDEVGADVVRFAIGDPVFGYVGSGGLSEYALLQDESALRPRDLRDVEAAVLPVAGATAYDGIEQLALDSGETVLITGIGGGIGSFAAQLAIARGARVLGTASRSKRAYVEALGAIHVSYEDDPVTAIRAETADSVSAVFDLVGGDALRALGGVIGRHTRVVAAADGTAAAEFGGSRVRRTRSASVLQTLGTQVVSGQLDPHVTAVIPFERARDAIALVESGHVAGKVVVAMT